MSSLTVPNQPRQRKPKAKPLSAVLLEIAEDEARTSITIGDITDIIKDRAYGALLLIIALPNIIPLPIPGVSTILGLPLLFIAWQLMVGAARPWLPNTLLRKEFARKDFLYVIEKAYPWLVKTEKLLKPRWSWLVSPWAERFIGFVCFVLAFILIWPIFLGNIMPALSISLFALAILAKDGFAVLMATLLSAFSITLVYAVLFATLKATIYFFTHVLFS